MKSFSLAWKSSSKSVKQRKYRMNSPLHLKRDFLSVSLLPALRTRYGMRNIEIRKGDTVKVSKGEFRGVMGKVSRTNSKQGLVFVEGVERIRKDGTKSLFPLQPANIILTELIVEDKKRIASLSRKTESKKPVKGKSK
jgi:large subunit ribosomal protein L24